LLPLAAKKVREENNKRKARTPELGFQAAIITPLVPSTKKDPMNLRLSIGEARA
jgi:hypothetical protein